MDATNGCGPTEIDVWADCGMMQCTKISVTPAIVEQVANQALLLMPAM